MRQQSLMGKMYLEIFQRIANDLWRVAQNPKDWKQGHSRCLSELIRAGVLSEGFAEQFRQKLGDKAPKAYRSRRANSR